MTDELVEQLARLVSKIRNDVPGYAGMADYEDAADIAVARECLRQMRFAYFMGRASEGRPVGMPEVEFAIAPEDWTP